MKQTTKSLGSKEQQNGHHQGGKESSWQVCQHRSKNVCRLGCLALYCILYMTLSSNPKVMDTRNDHSMDLPSLEQLQQVRQSHIKKASSMIARKFTPVSPNQWCLSNEFRFEQAKREPMGLCYLNIPETKSDVVQGITERIAQNFLQRHDPGTSSSCIRHHGPTPGTYYQRREKQRSFLFTLVRDPTERAMARVGSTMLKQRGKRANFFTVPQQATSNVTDNNNNATGEAVQALTEEEILSQQVLGILQSSMDVHYGTVSEGRGGFQLQYSMLHIIPEYSAWNASQPDVVQKPEDVQRRVQRVLEGYNFVGVVERMDESLVALQLLLGLETQDILYFASQLTPQYHRRVVPGSSGKHHYCQEQFKDGKNWLWTPAVEEYLHSTTWWAQNYGDLLLHEAASQSLDRTIHNEIGWKQFSTALREFHRWMGKAQEECHPVYPCSANGTDQFAESEKNCYPNHLACGYPCLDGLMKKKEQTPTTTTQTELDSDTESSGTGNGTSTDSSSNGGGGGGGTNKKTKKTKQQKPSSTSSAGGGGGGATSSSSSTSTTTSTSASTNATSPSSDRTATGSTSYGTSNSNTESDTSSATTGGDAGTSTTSTSTSTSTTSTGKKKKSTSTSTAAGTTSSGTATGGTTTSSTPKKKGTNTTGKRKSTSTSSTKTTATGGGNTSW